MQPEYFSEVGEKKFYATARSMFSWNIFQAETTSSLFILTQSEVPRRGNIRAHIAINSAYREHDVFCVFGAMRRYARYLAQAVNLLILSTVEIPRGCPTCPRYPLRSRGQAITSALKTRPGKSSRTRISRTPRLLPSHSSTTRPACARIRLLLSCPSRRLEVFRILI